MPKPIRKSKCCKAPMKEVGMGDFHDKDEICTMYWECQKCHQPCDPQETMKPIRKSKETGYKAKTQSEKNLAWYLPRPKKDRYKGGMPLYAEEWFMKLAEDILGKKLEKENILNIFCGMNKYGIRVDIKKEVNSDILADAHELTKHIKPLEQFDFIFADPPYSTEESKELYGTPPLQYKKWTAECEKLLKKGGLLCVYHKYIMPNPNPEKFIVVKRVFIGNRIYHLPRVAIYFMKK